MDAMEDKKALAALKKAVKKESGGTVLEISAATGLGLPALASRILKELDPAQSEILA